VQFLEVSGVGDAFSVFSRHRIRIRLVFDHLPLASTANVAEGAVRQRRRDGAAETGRQWIVTSADDLVPLSGGGRSVVYRRGDVVIRDAGPQLRDTTR
jgi:hypothetical protein